MQLTASGIAACLLAEATSLAQPYVARQTEDHGIAIVRLSDAAQGVEVSVVPSIGNFAYEMKVHGHNILHFPYADVSEFARRPGQCAIPLLAPWANRMTEQGFWANGKKYAFNLGLGNVRGALPIHGLLGIEAAGRTVEAIFGAKYPVAVVWEPAPPPGQTRDFICFEPMTAVTSGVNLAHEGKYPALQSVPAGSRWTESFWVRAAGI